MARATEHVATAAHEARRERAQHRHVAVAARATISTKRSDEKKTAPAEAEAVIMFS